jgi:hypothetical protein
MSVMEDPSWKRKSVAQVVNKSLPIAKPINILPSLRAHLLNLVFKILF